MPIYNLVMSLDQVSATRPWGGITSATYRESLSHISASQIYGLLMMYLTLEKIDVYGNSVESLLELIDVEEDRGLIIGSSDRIFYVSPALRFVETRDIVEFTTNLLEIPHKLLSQISYIWRGLIEVPKSIRNDISRKYGVEIPSRCMAPLWILPLLDIILMRTRDDKQGVIKRLCISPRDVRYMAVGVPMDRARKAGAYGKMYVYQTVVGTPNTYVSTVVVDDSIGLSKLSNLTTIASILGLGFKKSIRRTVESLTIIQPDLGIRQYRDLYGVIKEFYRYVTSIYMGIGNRYKLYVYHYDYSLSPLSIQNFVSNTLDEVRFTGFSDIYLAITNSFYKLAIDIGGREKQIPIVNPGSYYVEMVLDSSGLEKCVERYIDFPELIKSMEHSFKVYRRIDNRFVEPFKVEKRLVFNKLLASFVNLIPIPVSLDAT